MFTCYRLLLKGHFKANRGLDIQNELWLVGCVSFWVLSHVELSLEKKGMEGL